MAQCTGAAEAALGGLPAQARVRVPNLPGPLHSSSQEHLERPQPLSPTCST